jgi:hypothetical protein
VAERLNQLLDEPSVRTEPAPARQLLEANLELATVAAKADVTAPTAEAGLDDEGEGPAVGRFFPSSERPRLGMGQPGTAEGAGCDELVVQRSARPAGSALRRPKP